MNVKEEVKLLKAFGKLFSEQPDEEHRKPSDEPFPVMDSANVCMVVAVSKAAKRVLSRFSTTAYGDVKIPPLEYESDSAAVCKFSSDYLKLVMDCFAAVSDESVTMMVKRDYPLKIVGEDFYFILAPRVGEE